MLLLPLLVLLTAFPGAPAQKSLPPRHPPSRLDWSSLASTAESWTKRQLQRYNEWTRNKAETMATRQLLEPALAEGAGPAAIKAEDPGGALPATGAEDTPAGLAAGLAAGLPAGSASITLANGSFAENVTLPLDSTWANQTLQITGLAAAFSNLSGPLAAWQHLTSLSNLTYLDLHGNNLTGPVPTFLCQLSQLSFLFLSFNQLSGPIPSCISSLSNLQTLQLRNNQLNSTVPNSLGKIPSLATVDLSYNSLSGPIPGTLGPLPNITILGLSNNLLTSSLPPALCQMTSLRTLSVSSNLALSGGVPNCQAVFESLVVLNVTNTSLAGPAPTCAANSSTLTTLLLPPAVSCPSQDNEPCCGYADPDSGLCHLCTQFCQSCQPGAYGDTSAAPHRLSTGAIVGISLGALVLASLFLAGVVALLLQHKHRQAMKVKLEEWEEALQANAFHKFSLEEITMATQNFNSKRVLGQGAYGTVYLGVGPTGQEWAVKRSRESVRSVEAMQMFETEVRAVSVLSHSHLVRLLGYCSEGWEEILVYEFMPHGALSEHLYGDEAASSQQASVGEQAKAAATASPWLCWREMTGGAGGFLPAPFRRQASFSRHPSGNGSNFRSRRPGAGDEEGDEDDPRFHILTLEERLGVAIGVAEALAYLHNGVRPPLVHRDVKPSNILLDDSWQPKLADFGLLKALADGSASMGTRVVGTFGYIDPDYFRFQKVSTGTDVYSYGVVLLELVTGRRANIKVQSQERTMLMVMSSAHASSDVIVTSGGAGVEGVSSASESVEGRRPAEGSRKGGSGEGEEGRRPLEANTGSGEGEEEDETCSVHLTYWVRPLLESSDARGLVDRRIYDSTLDAMFLELCRLALRCTGPNRRRPDIVEVVSLVRRLRAEAFPAAVPVTEEALEWDSVHKAQFQSIFLGVDSSQEESHSGISSGSNNT